MTKTELIDATVSGVDGLVKAKAEQIPNVTLQVITESVGKGGAVSLIGFGTFSQGERVEHMARNPCAGEEIKVEVAKTVKFEAGRKFKDAADA